jgi:hypothetical protein
LLDGVGEDGVDRAHRDRVIEHVAEQLSNTADRTVADQRQVKDRLPQPSLRHRQLEKDLVFAGLFGRECLLKGQVLPLPRLHELCRARKGESRLWADYRNVTMAYHVCFLHETGWLLSATSLGETDNLRNPNRPAQPRDHVTRV